GADFVEFPVEAFRGDHQRLPARLDEGVASENGKNRTVSNWHGPASRKRSFLRGFNENQICHFQKTTAPDNAV
ncbi:hypothetical protein, partial [Aeromonas veronii]